jgi:hypothetical protein
MNCNWNQRGKRNNVLFFRHVTQWHFETTQWSNLRGSFQRSECLLGRWAFEGETTRLRRMRWATPLSKCWRGYNVSVPCALFRICYHADTAMCLVPYLQRCWYCHVPCSVSTTVLILAHAVFRICNGADTAMCLVLYLQRCWYKHMPCSVSATMLDIGHGNFLKI